MEGQQGRHGLRRRSCSTNVEEQDQQSGAGKSLPVVYSSHREANQKQEYSTQADPNETILLRFNHYQIIKSQEDEAPVPEPFDDDVPADEDNVGVSEAPSDVQESPHVQTEPKGLRAIPIVRARTAKKQHEAYGIEHGEVQLQENQI